MPSEHNHAIGDGCPGGHFATKGSDGSCCMAAQDTAGDKHAWNCEVMYRTLGEEDLARLRKEMGL